MRSYYHADTLSDLKKEKELVMREFGFFQLTHIIIFFPLAVEANLKSEQKQKAGAETFHKFQKFVTCQYICQ